MTPPLASFYTEPGVVVVDVGCVFTGLRGSHSLSVHSHHKPRTLSTSSCHGREWASVAGEHVRLLDGMHSALCSGLGTFLIPALVGDCRCPDLGAWH